MKVQIDSARCQGHGRCYDLAPELFSEDDEGYGQVVGEGIVPLAKAAEWVRARLPEIWSVAEQDRTKLEPAEAVRRNGLFLRKSFGLD